MCSPRGNLRLGLSSTELIIRTDGNFGTGRRTKSLAAWSSIPTLHVPRQAVPDAAYTGDQMAAVTNGPDGKIQGSGERSHDAPERWCRSHARRLVLIKPEINHVAHAVIAAGWRKLKKPEAHRTELVEPLFGPGGASYVMMDHAVVDDVTGEAELPSPVAVLNFAHVDHIVRRRQTDPRNGRHTIERAGP